MCLKKKSVLSSIVWYNFNLLLFPVLWSLAAPASALVSEAVPVECATYLPLILRINFCMLLVPISSTQKIFWDKKFKKKVKKVKKMEKIQKKFKKKWKKLKNLKKNAKNIQEISWMFFEDHNSHQKIKTVYWNEVVFY